ncbi:MAG TPA: extracellular solute-binding protein [Gemmatimonadales bacterium]
MKTGGRADGRTGGSLLVLWLLVLATPLAAQATSGPLTVFNAGSLAASFRDLLQAFAARHPGVEPRQESSGSLEAARKLTDLGRVPDVLGVADYQVLTSLIVPQHADWYATFARNSMVLIHTSRSIGARDITGQNWWQVLLRPGVRTGRSDPAQDPNGYRTLMVTQLAERHYRQPGLAGRLLAAMPPKYVRPKEADLVALVQAGELDYAWSYRNIAVTTGLPSVALPAEVDLSDPRLEGTYGQATVRIPAGRGADSLTLTGEPIVYAVTIPRQAPNPAAAAAFVRFVLSPDGQAILRRHGYILIDRPGVVGRPPAGVIPQ